LKDRKSPPHNSCRETWKRVEIALLIGSLRINPGFKFTDTLLKQALITKRFLQEGSDFLVILRLDLLQYRPDEMDVAHLLG
jgi:hypothetical protein